MLVSQTRRRPTRTPRCKTCRLRKVKCDYGHPECRRCVNAGIECGGYDKSMIVVMYGNPNDFIPPNPNNSSLDSYYAFLSRYLPQNRAMYDHHLQTGMELLASSQDQGMFPQLQVATNALSTVVMGRSQKQNGTVVSAMQLYGEALAGLRCSPVTMTNWLGAVMTAVALQLYETVEPSVSDGSGWMRHAVGICYILSKVGPEAVQEGCAHETFLGCRQSVTLGGLFFETPTLLSNREWQTVPWTIHEKTTLHRLFDVLAQLPMLLRLSHSIETKEQTAGFNMLQRHISAGLDAWMGSLKTMRKGKVFWSLAGELQFMDLTDAQMMTIYWEARLLCDKAANRVNPKPPSRYLEQCADNICSSCNFLQLDEFGIIGMQFSIMPLLVARGFYEARGFTEKKNACDVRIGQLTARPFSFLSVYT